MSERQAVPRARDLDAVSQEPLTPCVVIVCRQAGVAVLEPIVRMGGAEAVHAVVDARLAAQRCRELRPDLVVVDLDVPLVDGDEVLASIRCVLAEEEFLPLMVLSGDTPTHSHPSVLHAGAVDVVTTPFDHVELVGRVRNLLTMRGLYRNVQRHNVEVRGHV
jgi:DNA-binding response OmpR family regulator